MLKPVYDIKNCGPRHRYAANGKLIHNCDRVNLQNLPRKSKLKSAIIAPKGYVIVGADLSAIELRLGLAFGGQMDKVEALGRGVDLYKDFASQVYNIGYNEVTDSQRFMGKTCIAEGELVLTDKGLKPIETVLLDDKVWDGVEWVSHDGLIYQGERDVITYQHLTATPDHIVYLSDGSTCEFQEAANKGYQIVVTGDEGQEISLMGDNLARYMQKRQEASTTYTGEMPLWERGLANFGQFNVREEQTMSQLCIDTTTWTSTTSTGRRQFNTKTAETSERNASTMHQSKGQRIQKLWSPWYSVYVWFSGRMCAVYENFTKLFDRSYSRPDRQQRALRSGESEICVYERANSKQAEYFTCELEGSANTTTSVERKPLCAGVNSMQIHTDGINGGTDNSASLGFCAQQMQGMEQPKRKIRKVYDILNAGPRHRFTVSGKLVSNCQLSLIYGTGHNKLRQQTKQMSGIDIGESEAKRMVDLYRSDYTEVVSTWTQGDALLHAVRDNQYMQMGRNGVIKVMGHEGALLPSGLYMRYPDLRQSKVQTPDGLRKEWSVLKNKRERDKLYGSKVFQGLTQAMARCIIAEAMLRIAKKHRVLLTIHDAAYLLAREDEADDVLRFVIDQLRIPPAWMPDIPLDAEGGYGPSLDFKMGKIK